VKGSLTGAALGKEWAGQLRSVCLLFDPGQIVVQARINGQPDDLRQGKLFVRVDSSAWLAQLDRYLKRSIIKKINDKLDSRTVVNIIFRSGEVKPFTD
jgi:hypothetical protein